ncbi:aldose 1-epimerase [Candidatus Poribacteria bacterium]|nr:aldose 1-epimerase [Candidatus Poribacteria bacterium]
MSYSRYSVVKTKQEDMSVYILADTAVPCKAQIVPEFGNNCFSYSATIDNKIVDIIDPPPDLKTLKERPSGFGNPILFPFPNRIREGKFSFEGIDYQFNIPSTRPNSIHGLVLTLPWDVEKAEADNENGAQLVSVIKSADFPDAIRQFPFPFELKVTYSLKDGVLEMLTEATNLSDKNMPMGYGIHPYFKAPIMDSTDPEDCIITVPARKYWELEEFLPTGRILNATGKYNLTDGVPFSYIKFDDILTDVVLTDGVSRCFIDDKTAKMQMILESDPIFREIVVYTPPERRAICFEPYTCPTDAVNLHAKGIDAGLIILKPGESFNGKVRVILNRTYKQV